MNDIISKLTFGFIMAQAVPGAILFYSLSLWILFDPKMIELPIINFLNINIAFWFDSPMKAGLFTIGSISTGMIIHGLHWSTLGALEKRYKSIFRSFWHNYFIICQILLGPIKIIREIGIFLMSKHIRHLRIEENIPRVSPDKYQAFSILHDFYLHFSQFYAHSSYSLAFTSITFFYIFINSLFSTCFYTGYKFLIISILAYLFSGLMFVIGRAQLATLFNAEVDLYDLKK